jgi:hypothetical protein
MSRPPRPVARPLSTAQQARAAHTARRALRHRFLKCKHIFMGLPPHIFASVPMARFALEPLADFMLQQARNADTELPDASQSPS